MKAGSGLCAARGVQWSGPGGSSLARDRSEGHAAVQNSSNSDSSPRSLQQVPAPRCHFIFRSAGQAGRAAVTGGSSVT